MNKKITFFTEVAYILGIVVLAFGTALMERADFGMSMVVAPAYLIHLKISKTFSWFSFGIAEYCLQAFLLIVLSVVMRKFKKMYLFSFVTTLFYGFVLDKMILLVSLFPMEGIVGRLILYIGGMLVCSMSIALLFRTYIAPEAYELFVKEVAAKFNRDMSKTKIVYDCCSCFVAILLSFLFFGWGHFEGVKIGTVACALLNGWLIMLFGKLFDLIFDFSDGLKLRKYFC